MNHRAPPGQEPPRRLPSFVRTRLFRAGCAAGGVERVDWLTPYAAETIGAEARRAGPGARLEVTMASSTSEDALGTVEQLFAWVREKGVTLSVRRDESEG